MLFDKVMGEPEDQYKRRLSSVTDRIFDGVYSQHFNPFETGKTAADGNLRLRLKWKPQIKCQRDLRRGQNSKGEARGPRGRRAFSFGR